MARLPRAVLPGLPHHVTQRGNGRQQTFFSDEAETIGRPIGSESFCGRSKARPAAPYSPASAALVQGSLVHCHRNPLQERGFPINNLPRTPY